jgi:hypothetical protein
VGVAVAAVAPVAGTGLTVVQVATIAGVRSRDPHGRRRPPTRHARAQAAPAAPFPSVLHAALALVRRRLGEVSRSRAPRLRIGKLTIAGGSSRRVSPRSAPAKLARARYRAGITPSEPLGNGPTARSDKPAPAKPGSASDTTARWRYSAAPRCRSALAVLDRPPGFGAVILLRRCRSLGCRGLAVAAPPWVAHDVQRGDRQRHDERRVRDEE